MNFRHLVVLLLICIISAAYILHISIKSIETKHHDKPYVVCTTNLIGDALTQIAGDTITLDVLMGPGVDPHTYKPIQQDLFKIAQADIIFYHGLHLEARMTELFKHLANEKNIVAVTCDLQAEQLIYTKDQHLADPHVWFDPKLWIRCICTMSQMLQALCPKYAKIYQNNTQHLICSINTLYQTTLKQTNTIPVIAKTLITSHDAFSYFARAYHFYVVSLQGINTTSEAGVRDIQDIVKIIIDRHIPTIFVESSIPARSMLAIAQATQSAGFQVNIGQELYSDSLGSVDSDAATYITMLQHNIHSIVQGLTV